MVPNQLLCYTASSSPQIRGSAAASLENIRELVTPSIVPTSEDDEEMLVMLIQEMYDHTFDLVHAGSAGLL
jgi:hypothetical protein